MTLEKIRGLNELVEGDAALLLDFIEGRSATAAALSPLDWWFLAQGASTNCGHFKGQDEELALKWGRAAVSAYERCARELGGEPTRQDEAQTREVCAMWIRAWAIQRFGPNSQDSMLNPQILEDWFLERIPKFIAAQGSCPAYNPQMPHEDEMALYRFHDRIEILTPLVQQGIIRPDSVAGAWVLRTRPLRGN
jgi:hypothetical protein